MWISHILLFIFYPFSLQTNETWWCAWERRTNKIHLTIVREFYQSNNPFLGSSFYSWELILIPPQLLLALFLSLLFSFLSYFPHKSLFDVHFFLHFSQYNKIMISYAICLTKSWFHLYFLTIHWNHDFIVL